MSRPEEHATWNAGRSRPRTFPESWGSPIGAPASEERAEWVLDQVQTHTVVGRAARLRQLQERGEVLARLAELKAKVARLR